MILGKEEFFYGVDVSAVLEGVGENIFEGTWHPLYPEDIYENIAEYMSDFYRLCPNIRALEYKEHFYNHKHRKHLYVVEKHGNRLEGFLIYKHGKLGWCIRHIETAARHWERFKCSEDLTAPRTLGEVFDEF